jgi:hypothetical protein
MNHTTTSYEADPPHGLALLNDPAPNKCTAFTEEERRCFGLEGLLSVESIDRQVELVSAQLEPKQIGGGGVPHLRSFPPPRARHARSRRGPSGRADAMTRKSF